jgi:hypothetical protein
MMSYKGEYRGGRFAQAAPAAIGFGSGRFEMADFENRSATYIQVRERRKPEAGLT